MHSLEAQSFSCIISIDKHFRCINSFAETAPDADFDELDINHKYKIPFWIKEPFQTDEI